MSEIKAGEHVLCVGQTGSGKSVMLQAIIRALKFAPVFVLDTKFDDGFLNLNLPSESLIVFGGKRGKYAGKSLKDFVKYIRQPPRMIDDYVIIRPTLFEVNDPFILDQYILAIHLYFKPKCAIAVDELYMLHKGGRCGPGLTAALTRGRHVGHSLLGATQRPSWISRFCISEVSNYYIFRLMEPDDRKRFQHIGYDKMKIMDRYHYFHYNVPSGEGGEFPPIKPDFLMSDETPERGRWL